MLSISLNPKCFLRRTSHIIKFIALYAKLVCMSYVTAVRVFAHDSRFSYNIVIREKKNY